MNNSKKIYMDRLKIEDPERYRRYKGRNKAGDHPVLPIVHDPTVVKANKRRRKLNVERNRAKRIRKYLNYVKDSFGCFNCSETYNGCLEFHHVDPNSKDDDISSTLHNGSIKRLTEEMSKCVVLCSNCHKKLHGGLFVIDVPIGISRMLEIQNKFVELFHKDYNKFVSSGGEPD